MKISLAIVVVAYNREKSLYRLLKSIGDAYIDDNTSLIISIDKSDNSLVSKVAEEFYWPYGEKKIVLQHRNLGLRKHILGCGQYLNEYDAIIVLEDDLIVSPDFYNYSRKALESYADNQKIAGISLYSYQINPHTKFQFHASKNQYDAYFLQYGPSWGQVWMRKQWKAFEKWYALHNEEFSEQPYLPNNICNWGEKSWLKYHIKYAIENNLYFVYPYTALSSTCGDSGEHTSYNSSFMQVVLQQGTGKEYTFPPLNIESVRYDAFFERIFKVDNFEDICIDLNCTKNNKTNNRFWLTTQIADYRVIERYNLSFKPIEANINKDNKGDGIYLYDTHYKEKNNSREDYHIKLYYYELLYMCLIIKDYGFKRLYREVRTYLSRTFHRRFSKRH